MSMRLRVFCGIITLIGVLACGGAPTPSEPSPAASRTAAVPAPDPYLLDTLFAYASEDALRAKYGSAVSTVQILVNEAGDMDFVALHADTPREVIFEFPTSLRVRQKGSPWKSRAGVHTGMELVELEKLNGGPFELMPGPDGVEVRLEEKDRLWGHNIYLASGDDMYPALNDVIQSDTPAAKALNLVVREFYVHP